MALTKAEVDGKLANARESVKQALLDLLPTIIDSNESAASKAKITALAMKLLPISAELDPDKLPWEVHTAHGVH